MAEERAVFAVGSQVFVDLWALMGFSPLPCESPGNLSGVFETLGKEKAALVVAEERWFAGLQEPLRKKLEKSGDPVWIQFPSCEGSEMR